MDKSPDTVSKLSAEASMLGGGLAAGIWEKAKEVAAHPLTSAAEVGGTTAATWVVGAVAQKFAPAALGAVKYVMGAALIYQVGKGALATAGAIDDTWERPDHSIQNQKIIADSLGKPLAETAIYSLAGAGGLWHGARTAREVSSLASSLELQATRRPLHTHIPLLNEVSDKKSFSLLEKPLITSLAAAKDKQLAGVYRENAASVVQVMHAAGPHTGNGTLATGFIVDENLIATNNHVLHGHSTPIIRFLNGETVEAKLVARDKTADLALLKVPAGSMRGPGVALGNGSEITEQSRVIMIGHPRGVATPVASAGRLTARQGQKFIHPSRGSEDPFPSSEHFVEYISNKGNPALRDVYRPTTTANVIRRDVLSHTAATQPGNSGSPLFDGSGRVIGVHSHGGQYRWGSSVEHLKALLYAYRTAPPTDKWLRVITDARPVAETVSNRPSAYTRILTDRVEVTYARPAGVL